jgi:hypothetical protein
MNCTSMSLEYGSWKLYHHQTSIHKNSSSFLKPCFIDLSSDIQFFLCVPCSGLKEVIITLLVYLNPFPALTYQNVLDLNVACQAKRTQTYWHIRKFKCPLKKTQPSCPCSRDLNWTGKGLIFYCADYLCTE